MTDLLRPFSAPPVTAPVSSDAPVRLSVLAPPYTVINLSTEGTAWLSDSTSVQVNTGTPLYPGTSLQWNRPGSLWAIGDSDFLIQISYDVTDWEPNPIAIATAILNSGLIIIDQPIVLFDGTLDAFGDPNDTTGIIDVSRFQSALIAVVPDSSPAPTFASFSQINLTTGSFGGLSTPLVSITRRLTFINSSFMQLSIPILGDGLIVSSVDPLRTFGVVVMGSHRPYPMIQEVFSPSAGAYHYLLFEQPAVASATTTNLDAMLPFFGDTLLRVVANSGAAGGGTAILIFDPLLGGQIQRIQMAAVGASTVAVAETVVPCFGIPYRVGIENATGAQRSYNVTASPITSSTGAF